MDLKFLTQSSSRSDAPQLSCGERQTAKPTAVGIPVVQRRRPGVFPPKGRVTKSADWKKDAEQIVELLRKDEPRDVTPRLACRRQAADVERCAGQSRQVNAVIGESSRWGLIDFVAANQ